MKMTSLLLHDSNVKDVTPTKVGIFVGPVLLYIQIEKDAKVVKLY